MARFSLSFFSIFLVLAAFAMSMPTKRDLSQGLGLGNALTQLQVGAHDLIFPYYPC
jgi:lipopolysaccharide export LptBFGC system permease protein LptF